jgi:hypothetical protein
MVPAEFGEKGEWTLLGTEGTDQDGDGLVAEDGPGGVDLNRNFPAGWKPPYQQFGAGPYPTSEPEIRAVAAFLREHANIAAVQSFHNSGNLIINPPGPVDDKTLPPRDYEVYKAIARRGEKLLPGYKSINSALELYPVNGSTLDWAYYACGALGFTNEIWDVPREFRAGNDATAEEQLKFLDVLTHRQAFIPWHPFRHPIYGDIELGGYDQFSTRIPPVEYLEDICERNTQFVLFHAESTPLLKIEETRVTKEADGVWRLQAIVVNDGNMDTMPEATRQTGVYRPVFAELQVPKGVTVVEGAERGEYIGTVDQARETKPGTRRREEARVDLGTIRGGAKKIVQWLLVAPAGVTKVTLRVHGRKGGEDEREILLR